MSQTHASVDEYIASFPPDVQQVLQAVRRTIHDVVPECGERISYQIPTMTVAGKTLMYFAGWAHHVSVYPVPEGDEDLEAAVAPYRVSKGTLKFALAEPIPYDVIEKVARAHLARFR